MDWSLILTAVLVIIAIIGGIRWIFPHWLSKLILFFRKYPTESSGILNYINQYLESDDELKVYIAKGILKRNFDKKFEEFIKNENEYWDGLKNKVEVIPLRDAIKEIEHEFEKYGEPVEIKPETENQAGVYIGGPPPGGPRGPGGALLKKLLEIYQGWYEKDKNAKLWYLGGISQGDLVNALDIDLTPRPDEGYPPVVLMGRELPYRAFTSEEAARILHIQDSKLIEINGIWTPEDVYAKISPSAENFLSEIGLENHTKEIENKKDEIFDKILLDLNLSEDNKRNFSKALSDRRDSVEKFKTLIKKTFLTNL